MNAAWVALRRQVIARAGGICEKCHERKGQHVHHLMYGGRKRGTEPLEWLQLLCLRCHGDAHPNHTFRTLAQQAAIHRKRLAHHGPRHGDCQHCGGMYSRAKHRSICIKFDLNGPRHNGGKAGALSGQSVTVPKNRPAIYRNPLRVFTFAIHSHT